VLRRTITWCWNFNANTPRHLHWNNETETVALVIQSHFQMFKNIIKSVWVWKSKKAKIQLSKQEYIKKINRPSYMKLIMTIIWPRVPLIIKQTKLKTDCGSFKFNVSPLSRLLLLTLPAPCPSQLFPLSLF
jgi:hypothetical protein